LPIFRFFLNGIETIKIKIGLETNSSAQKKKKKKNSSALLLENFL
jgi:hypothetical protein